MDFFPAVWGRDIVRIECLLVRWERPYLMERSKRERGRGSKKEGERERNREGEGGREEGNRERERERDRTTDGGRGYLFCLAGYNSKKCFCSAAFPPSFFLSVYPI